MAKYGYLAGVVMALGIVTRNWGLTAVAACLAIGMIAPSFYAIFRREAVHEAEVMVATGWLMIAASAVLMIAGYWPHAGAAIALAIFCFGAVHDAGA